MDYQHKYKKYKSLYKHLKGGVDVVINVSTPGGTTIPLTIDDNASTDDIRIRIRNTLGINLDYDISLYQAGRDDELINHLGPWNNGDQLFALISNTCNHNLTHYLSTYHDILVDFYNDLDGINWDFTNMVKWNNLINNENQGRVPNGIEVDYQCRIITIELSGKNLSGTIPDSIRGRLTHLIDLSLSHNNIIGDINDIFTNIRNFDSLEEILLDENNITGDIGNLLAGTAFPSLKKLKLNNNTITGDISNLITNLSQQSPDFETLDLSNTGVSGNIDVAALEQCSELEYIDFRNTNVVPLPPGTRIGSMINEAGTPLLWEWE